MPLDTERFYSERDTAQQKLTALDKARNDALYAIELIADGLRDKTGVSPKDAQCLLDHASDGLDDMLGDIRQGLLEEIENADETIEAFEHSDLMLSRPVW